VADFQHLVQHAGALLQQVALAHLFGGLLRIADRDRRLVGDQFHDPQVRFTSRRRCAAQRDQADHSLLVSNRHMERRFGLAHDDHRLVVAQRMVCRAVAVAQRHASQPLIVFCVVAMPRDVTHRLALPQRDRRLRRARRRHRRVQHRLQHMLEVQRGVDLLHDRLKHAKHIGRRLVERALRIGFCGWGTGQRQLCQQRVAHCSAGAASPQHDRDPHAVADLDHRAVGGLHPGQDRVFAGGVKLRQPALRGGRCRAEQRRAAAAQQRNAPAELR
jgi:hypothetical protein